ncbi:MAG: T9SS type A sorting domain-containing protein [Flavobacteriales bacterium]|nr:T9SS type A sorting domain-containing protein [Flavobacteriales bacterium]
MNRTLLSHVVPALLLGLFPFALSAQQTEIEPNENYLQATNWTYGQTMEGSECNPPAFDTDYFRIVLPSDGVITFTVTSQGSGPTPGDLQFALFPKAGFYAQYHTLPGTLSPTTQTFSHSCLSGDTMYVRVQEINVGPNSCVSYTMAYSVDPTVFANDAIPNDDPQNPQIFTLGQSFEGHLEHLYDNSQDWYGVTLPVDGTVRIIAEAEHADAATTGVLQVYLDVNNSTYTLPIGAAHVATIDTFTVRCFAAQFMRVKVSSGNTTVCGISYRLRFELIPQVFSNDIGPNNDPTDPEPIAVNTPVEGHLNFFGDGSSDWYGLPLPDDGTLRVIAEAEQHDTISNGLVNVYVDQLNSSIQVPVGASSIAGLDTFYFNCVRAGLIKVAVQPANSNGCGISYRLRFGVLPPEFGNDPEPNESIATAVVVPPDTDQDGHLTYIGTSNQDYFKLWKGFPGTLRIVFASSTRGPSPALRVYIANTNSTQTITTGVDGEVAYDTVLVYTANPDTVAMSIAALQGDYCGSYRFRHESAPVGIADAEAVRTAVVTFPNPSEEGVFTLRATGERMVRVEVLDLNGRTVWTRAGLDVHQAAIDLSAHPGGVYAAQVHLADGSVALVRLVSTH